MRAHEQGDKAASPRRERRTRLPDPAGDQEEILALQRTLGNAATAELIEQGDGESVHDVLRGPGRSLDPPLRQEMEARLGADFSGVRVHDDATAHASAAGINARAYTSGEHVVIGSGGADKHTLAHELTHVIQQRSGPVAGTDGGDGLRISDPSDRFERAAEATARTAMAGPVPRTSTVNRAVQRGREPGVVQRLRSIDEDGVTYQLTESDRYAIIKDQPSIFALPNATVSDALARNPNGDRTINGQLYHEYQTRRYFLRDCLHTAEEIINNRPGELPSADELGPDAPASAGLHSRIKGPSKGAYRKFGRGDDENIELAQEFPGPKDHDAAPGLGEAFVTLATLPRKTAMSPYHAAGVVAIDGNDRVTLEEWDAAGLAGLGGAAIYRVGDTTNSFHAYWHRNYFSEHEPVTVVVRQVARPGQLAGRSQPFRVNDFSGNEDIKLELTDTGWAEAAQ